MHDLCSCAVLSSAKPCRYMLTQRCYSQVEVIVRIPAGMHSQLLAYVAYSGLGIAHAGKTQARCTIQLRLVVMQAGASGAPKEAPRKGLRKIRPTVPVLAPSSGLSVPVPAIVARLAANEQSNDKRKLQSAFLAMYSNTESKVPSMLLCPHSTEG